MEVDVVSAEVDVVSAEVDVVIVEGDRRMFKCGRDVVEVERVREVVM